jgi:hypothetical protein
MARPMTKPLASNLSKRHDNRRPPILQFESDLAYAYIRVAALRMQLAFKAGFDPSQNRDGGGRWSRIGGAGGGSDLNPHSGDNGSDGVSDTSAGSSAPIVEYGGPNDSWQAVASTYDPNGDLKQQAIANRDGSTIQSEFNRGDACLGFDERHTVITTDGNRIAFETSGAKQTISDDRTGAVLANSVWSENGPLPAPGVQPAYDPSGATIVAGVTAAITLHNWMSSKNDDAGAAVLAFKANEYGTGGEPKLEPEWVGRVSRDQVDAACPRHGEVQERTDAAAVRAQREGNYYNAATYGTAVHSLLKQDIDTLADRDFRAEVSLMKSDPKVHYGIRGSIRVDVLENVGNGTVCVYDIKTGERGLSLPRSKEIAGEVYSYYTRTTRIIVVETRPRR